MAIHKITIHPCLSAWQEWLLHDVLADGESQPEVHVLGQQVALAAELAAVRKDARLRGAGRSVARFVRFGFKEKAQKFSQHSLTSTVAS